MDSLISYPPEVRSLTQSFNNFVEKRLMPGVQKLGITGEPKIEILPVHATFTPGYSK